jgi:hypothetical protein
MRQRFLNRRLEVGHLRVFEDMRQTLVAEPEREPLMGAALRFGIFWLRRNASTMEKRKE